uniref:Microsomal glutathione S-transferase 1 n=1 Tax=Eurytemora affinis TaxID=88015 RepID=A0A8B0MCT0_EURAF|nr:mGST4 [Eurytemora affinis]
MDVDKQLFEVFAFHGALLLVKTCIMSFLTARQRFAKNIFISSEDRLNKKTKIGTGLNDDIERVRRAHQNDIENIFPFLTLGFLYLFTNPALSTATTVFRIFSGARIAHSIVYLLEVPQPARVIAFMIGNLANVFLGFQVLTFFKNSM